MNNKRKMKKKKKKNPGSATVLPRDFGQVALLLSLRVFISSLKGNSHLASLDTVVQPSLKK
jgi:hypothetical protein